MSDVTKSKTFCLDFFSLAKYHLCGNTVCPLPTVGNKPSGLPVQPASSLQTEHLHVSIHRCCLLARELYMYICCTQFCKAKQTSEMHEFGSRVCSASGRQAQGICTFHSYPTVKRPMNHPARFLKQCLKKWLHHEKVEFAMIRKSPSANANMSTISPLHRFPCASAQIVCRTP